MRPIILSLFCFFFLHINTNALGQQSTGVVLDAVTHTPVPFATVRYGTDGQGVIASLDGVFSLPGKGAYQLEVSCIGYVAQIASCTTGSNCTVYLKPAAHNLGEVVVKPPISLIRRVLNAAIAAKDKNNPDKYTWYQCSVYYKTIADLQFPDSIMADTSSRSRKKQQFVKNQHLFLSETYSRRTWAAPARLQEDVMGTRFSGFKEPLFSSLITDVVPFHAYADFLKLGNIDYHNPVSRGYEQYYKWTLADEVIEGGDTTWVLGFRPKGHGANNITGSVHISSKGFAISHIVAATADTMLRLRIRIEQEYRQVPYSDNASRWFPSQLNYIIDWKQTAGSNMGNVHMKGNSFIDSVLWQVPEDGFRFDKAHTVRLAPTASIMADSLRPQPLTAREARTYTVMDSLGAEYKLDKIAGAFSGMQQSLVSIGKVDLMLNRFVAINYYENWRLGAGLQTNSKLSRKVSVGGWAGYGFGDQQWKFGLFAEAYAGKYRDFVVRAGYEEDLIDPGRVRIHKDLDYTGLKVFLLQRVDFVKSQYLTISKKLGYWQLMAGAAAQDVQPKYPYYLLRDKETWREYRVQELSLGVRYAFAERTAPLLGTYYSMGSKYPIIYGRVVGGIAQSGSDHERYVQALAAFSWTKQINRVGKLQVLLEGGQVWANGPVPLGKTFAGNGFRYDSRATLRQSIYVFGGLMAAYPYQFYTDRFVSTMCRYDINRKLYQLESKELGYSSAPNLAFQYNMLVGSMGQPGAQQPVSFSVPVNGYQEAGLILANIVRIRYFDLFYLGINTGYFVPFANFQPDLKNGRFVIGMGIDM